MRRFYQTEWFGLDLAKITETSPFKMANKKFYDDFYKIFYSKYSSYDQLPNYYIEKKVQVANHLFSFIKNKNDILSIGCGIGLIEQKLSELLEENKVSTFQNNNIVNRQKIIAIEPSISTIQWIDSDFIEVVHGFYPEVIDQKIKFDLVYAILIDYTLNNTEYLFLLKNIVKSGAREVYFSVSVDSPLTIVSKLKELSLLLLCAFGIKSCGQLWGYLRTIEEHKSLFKEAGFQTICIGRYRDGQYYIHAEL